MIRKPQILALLMLLAAALSVRAAAAPGAIYTWTDRDGVIHFGDAPPAAVPAAEPADTAPARFDDDTPVPATLNELFEPGRSAGAADDDPGDPGRPAAASGNRGFATAPIPYVPGSGTRPLAPPGAAGSTPIEPGGPGPGDLSIEELEALDPIWFRGNSGAATTELRVDEHGPYTIGELMEDQRVPPEQRCAMARRDLEVLLDAWPVYRDQGGRLRFQWARDPYRGARRYLDHEARDTALAAVRQTLRRDCEGPDDPRARAAARDRLLQAALCEAERAELAALESLGGVGPTQTLPDKRALAAAVCGDPSAPEDPTL